MANLTLNGSCFFLGESSYNGTGSQGATLYLNNAQVSHITMMSDPSSVPGQPYTSWNNTSSNSLYRENYIGDDINLDLGEAIRLDLNGNGDLAGEPWLRVTDFDRYTIAIRMDDDSIITGVGNIISARNPATGKIYQTMVLGDNLVKTLNDTNMNINRIQLMEYVPTGATGGDLTQRFNMENFANEVAEFSVVPCFGRGTRIATDRGEVAVEDLAPGDRVLTADHGPQEIRWVGARRVPALGKFAPIVFASGAIGNHRALSVSPQHRMLIGGATAAHLFGAEELLVPAKALVNGTTIRACEGGWVDYFHILLDDHQVIFAEGARAESLYLGPQSLKALSREGRAEILALFPELEAAMDQGIRPPGARPFLTVRQGRDFAAAAPELV